MQDCYVSPVDASKLVKTDDPKGCKYIDSNNNSFELIDDIPNFIYPVQLDSMDKAAKTFYDDRAESYDDYLHLTFETFFENENDVRDKMISYLSLSANQRVLEVGCGTGRDSIKLRQKIGQNGQLFLQDISINMIKKAREKLLAYDNVAYCLSNAAYLPYPDNYFDCLYQFGGVGEFSDIRRFLSEAVRVVKQGGKVVIGDESMPIWLRNSEFGKILINHNPQFAAKVPLEDMPVEAREVTLRWLIGGTFYLIEFNVGEGEPRANFDFEIPGVRGGSHRTRLHGQLEGVTPEAKELAHRAREKLGISMHQWLDELVKKESQRILKNQ